MTIVSWVLGAETGSALAAGKKQPAFDWLSCGGKLSSNKERAGAALFLLGSHSVNKSPDFLLFAATIMAAESDFDAKVISSAGATGLMQVTLIGAREAGKQCHLPYDNDVSDEALMERLLDPKANIKYGTCLLNHYMNQVRRNQVLSLILYNGGGKQLTRFLTTGSLHKETAEYVLRTQSYYGRCIQ